MRVANFNCENLFARHNLDKNVDPTKEDGFLIDQTAFDIFDDAEKKLTAEAIKEVNADVIALEEVESLRILDLINSKYLKNLYSYDVLIDAHDPRKINVAVLSKYPIISVRTHRNEKSSMPKEKWLFSRDCLEVEIDVDGKPLFLYVNHLKSMMEGCDKTKPHRVEQSKRVAEIIDEKWKDNNYEGNFIVLGDLNDYPDQDTGISALLEHPGLKNVIGRLPADDQWTHYWAEKKEYSQLNYFLSKSLAKQNTGSPGIMRKGIAKAAVKDTDEMFKGVENTKPVASDHAPVYMDIQLG